MADALRARMARRPKAEPDTEPGRVDLRECWALADA